MKTASADGNAMRKRRMRTMLTYAAAMLALCATLPLTLKADPPGGRAASGHSRPSAACDSAAFEIDTDDGALFDCAGLLPGLVRDQIFLKRFIRDPRFFALRRACSDTAAVDAIFLRALEIADGNIEHALLVAMFGTMDHFRLRLRLPLVGVLTLPLTTESDSTFGVRHHNLPRRVLPDSIGRTESDKDKLQHFFGSAYLAYFTNSNALSRFMGNFIETGEAAIVVGGANDERDKFANALGREFGFRLLDGEELLPSDVLWKEKH